MANKKITRFDDLMTTVLDTRTMDRLNSMWELVLYAEYCSWAGFGKIELSLRTIAKKLAKQYCFAEKTIYDNLKEAKRALLDKGIISYDETKGYRGAKKVILRDTHTSRSAGKYANVYGKERKELYGMGGRSTDDL